MSTPPTSTARQLDPASVQAGLRRLARAPEAPWLHGEVARRMAGRLEFIRLKPQVVLDWWAFGGASTELLLKAYPQARHLAVEPTQALHERSQRALAAPWWSARRWRGVGASLVTPDAVSAGSVQLLWANMMLHAVVDPAALMQQWQRLLAVDGFVMFSCLGPGTLRSVDTLYAQRGWGAPLAPFVDMHDLGDMLVQAGFADPVMDQEVLTLSWDSPEALLRELRSLGPNAAPRRFAGLRTPRWREQLLGELRHLARPDGRLYLDFEVAYGHAFKAAPKAPLASETRVSIDDMRAMVRSKSPRG
ncbi:MAG TPA: biotin synthase [Rhizobacter sp.]